MSPIDYPETSVRNYRYTLHTKPAERISPPLRGGILKSFIDQSSRGRGGGGRQVYRRRQHVEVVGLFASVAVCGAAAPSKPWPLLSLSALSISVLRCCALISNTRLSLVIIYITELQSGRSRVRFPMVSLEFFIDIIHPAALWPWGRLSL